MAWQFFGIKEFSHSLPNRTVIDSNNSRLLTLS
jgi:hypothetical protein